MKRVASIVAIILTVITLLIVTWELRRIVVLFILSLGLAATARAPIDWWMARNLPRAYATAIVYGVTFVVLVGLLYAISVPLANEMERLVHDITAQYGRLQASGNANRFAPLLARLPTSDQVAAFLAGGETGSIAQTALDFTSTLVENVSEILIAIVLSMYWTTDELRFERLWLSLLPAEKRVRARNAWRSLESGVGAYIRSELLQSLLAGLLLFAGFWLLGLHYPVMWALLAALAWLIPLVGAFLAVLPLGLIASVNVGTFTALAAMPALKGLAVSCQNVADAALAALPSFPSLRSLMPMNVTEAGFRHVGRCEQLENLWCMYCQDTGDAATEYLTNLTKLKTYYAGKTKITDRSLEILSRLSSLESLEFWECGGITNAGLAALASLPQLREITVSGAPNVTRAGLAVFPAHMRVNYW